MIETVEKHPEQKQNILDEENQRWAKYRKVNSQNRYVRDIELNRILALINPAPNDIILEAGSGSGYLTRHLSGKNEPHSTVVSMDIDPAGLQELQNKVHDWQLPITTHLMNLEPWSGINVPPFFKNHFTKVVSLATMHHFDNRNKGTGEAGRINLFKTAYSSLKKGGGLIVADVANDTITQKYFDKLDNPRLLAPHGHPHDFFNISRLKALLEEIGFTDVNITIEKTPWHFKNKEHALHFIHNIHNAKCTPPESLALAEKTLGIITEQDHIALNWELFFLTAKK